MGAVTVAIRAQNPLGGVARSVVADITFSGTYAAGGDTYTASQFGMSTVLAMIPQGCTASATTNYVPQVDIANSKIKLMGGAASGVALAETGTAGQTGTVARMLVIGNHPYV